MNRALVRAPFGRWSVAALGGALAAALGCAHPRTPAPPRPLEVVPVHEELSLHLTVRWPKILPCEPLDLITVGEAAPEAVWTTADGKHGLRLGAERGDPKGARGVSRALSVLATPVSAAADATVASWSAECAGEPGSVSWTCVAGGCAVAATYPLPAPHQPDPPECLIPACTRLADGQTPALAEAEQTALVGATRAAALDAARWLAAACGRGQCAEPWNEALVALEGVAESTWTFESAEARRVHALAGRVRVDLLLDRDAHVGGALTTALSVELAGDRLVWAVDLESHSAGFDFKGSSLTLADGAVRLSGDRLVLGEPPRR